MFFFFLREIPPLPVSWALLGLGEAINDAVLEYVYRCQGVSGSETAWFVLDRWTRAALRWAGTL